MGCLLISTVALLFQRRRHLAMFNAQTMTANLSMGVYAFRGWLARIDCWVKNHTSFCAATPPSPSVGPFNNHHIFKCGLITLVTEGHIFSV